MTADDERREVNAERQAARRARRLAEGVDPKIVWGHQNPRPNGWGAYNARRAYANGGTE